MKSPKGNKKDQGKRKGTPIAGKGLPATPTGSLGWARLARWPVTDRDGTSHLSTGQLQE